MKLNFDYTFENYIIGNNNKAAEKVIFSAISLPGQIYNPIFIYGMLGTGKTHLLQAFAQEVRKSIPPQKIYCATSEQFINGMTMSIQDHKYGDFIGYCMNLDVLLIDDVHLLMNRKSTLEELLSILKRLYNAHKQIIVSADRLPRKIFKTDDDIFKKGQISKISPPAYKDRLRFLQVKASRLGVSMSKDILGKIARKARLSFRELEGVLVRTKFSSCAKMT